MKTVAQMMEEAMTLNVRGDMVGCVQGLQRVLLSDPNHAEAWNNRAGMLLKLGHPFDAIMNYEKAMAIAPEMAELYSNRGVAYVELGMLDKAMDDYKRAIELNSQHSETFMNVAIIHGKRHELPEAIEFYRKAIEANDKNSLAHFGLAVSLLESGEFIEGWREFEWRWNTDQMVPRGLHVPEWNGERTDNPSDVLLFYAEQGHGDALQFMRFAPQIKQKWGGQVWLEVRQPMTRLARTMEADGVIALGEKLPQGTVSCLPMMSAPRVLGTTLKTIPVSTYLKADPYRVRMWRKKLAALPPGMKVGICWAGGARPFQPIANAVNKKRSTTLAEFAPLAVPGISFVSLQVGPENLQVRTPPVGMTIGDWSDEIDDFHDTAALIECLDLVISVDTSVVHLAGAMGKPVWLLSRYDNCWRWLNDRKDSPWYPSLTQFRQPSQGDWSGMMNEVREQLHNLIRKAA